MEKWDANTPIEMLFNQIDDAQDFAAAAGQPYTNNQLLTTAYNLVYATGLFFDLATATASHRQALQNLTNMVKELRNQIKAKDKQIKDLLKAMNHNTTSGSNTKSTRWEKKDCGSYCHTHGYLVGPKHNSETCQQPGPNHNQNGTRQNPMGGNLEGRPDTNT